MKKYVPGGEDWNFCFVTFLFSFLYQQDGIVEDVSKHINNSIKEREAVLQFIHSDTVNSYI